MKSNIINIGNSKGIIIPSKFLKLIGIKEAVNIDLKENKLVISPVKIAIRDNWEEMIINELKNNGQPKRLYLIPHEYKDTKNNLYELLGSLMLNLYSPVVCY